MALIPRNRPTWLALALVLGATAAAQETPAFKVIVNAANPVSSMRRQDTAALFLAGARWKNGEAAPVDQSVQAPVRDVFSQIVLGQSVEAVKVYWQKKMVSERKFPPPVKGSDADVVAHVAKNRGGIGYVTGATALPPGVKALTITE